MSRCFMAGILAGVVLFIWSAISWMVLPWHTNTLKTFSNEKSVTEIISTSASHSGMYMLPMQIKDGASTQPQVFAAISLKGMQSSMAIPMLISLLTQIVAALLVAWLLSKTSGLTYCGRVEFVMLFALAATIISNLPNWTWFMFDTNYTLVAIADTLIGWFFASLVLARYCR